VTGNSVTDFYTHSSAGAMPELETVPRSPWLRTQAHEQCADHTAGRQPSAQQISVLAFIQASGSYVYVY
jgi:hypothetical protein